MKNYKEMLVSNERLNDGNEWLKTSVKQCALLALINIRLYEVYGSHNMFDGIQCETIQNELLIWKEH